MRRDKAAQFVEHLVELTEDTGTRAALRSGLGRTVNQADRMHAYLARWTSSSRPHEEAVYYTIAALIAHNPAGAVPAKPPGNIGASIACATKLAPVTREKSVHLLARQPAGQLCRMLTRIILPLRSGDEPTSVDFVRLVEEATRWPWRHQEIGREWLQAYYRTTDEGHRLAS
jgi:CRISPR type I-E-associated protein CasB/Cse2